MEEIIAYWSTSRRARDEAWGSGRILMFVQPAEARCAGWPDAKIEYVEEDSIHGGFWITRNGDTDVVAGWLTGPPCTGNPPLPVIYDVEKREVRHSPGFEEALETAKVILAARYDFPASLGVHKMATHREARDGPGRHGSVIDKAAALLELLRAAWRSGR